MRKLKMQSALQQKQARLPPSHANEVEMQLERLEIDRGFAQSREYFHKGLTPELSRAALRPWASETCKNLHEAAKRARLERIVRPVPAVLLANVPI